MFFMQSFLGGKFHIIWGHSCHHMSVWWLLSFDVAFLFPNFFQFQSPWKLHHLSLFIVVSGQGLNLNLPLPYLLLAVSAVLHCSFSLSFLWCMILHNVTNLFPSPSSYRVFALLSHPSPLQLFYWSLQQSSRETTKTEIS